MIRVTDTISLDDSELSESFVRASGPGGQNVNKVSSAVQLRFDARQSPSLPNDVAIRLMRLAGSRLTKDGVIVIVAQEYRDQSRNRAEARATAETLAKNGCPVRTFHVETLDEAALGELMMHFMLETIIAAHLMGIDAFDQPAVEEGKVLAKKYLLG